MAFLRTLIFFILIGVLSAVDSQASYTDSDFNENIRTAFAGSTAVTQNEPDSFEGQQSITQNTTNPSVYYSCKIKIGVTSALVGTLVVTYAAAYMVCNADCSCQALSICAGGFGYLVIDLIKANLGLS